MPEKSVQHCVYSCVCNVTLQVSWPGNSGSVSTEFFDHLRIILALSCLCLT